jgi:hypothetical protein
MKQISGKLKWAVALSALVLLVMAAYAYFIGTRAMLTQAEAFAFRRMTVPQLAEQGTFLHSDSRNLVSGCSIPVSSLLWVSACCSMPATGS